MWTQFKEVLMNVQDDDILAFAHYINGLHLDIESRFDEVLTMEISIRTVQLEELDIGLQEQHRTSRRTTK